jgi:tight adherence protein B
MFCTKKTEQKILNIMPFAVIGLLLMMSPDYLSPLYDSIQGQIIMTVCVALTIMSYLLSKKIADIAL